ncbi:Protein phosphatase PTC7 [Mortierella sp. AD032]|nr:Protein phosphatase PTC7 [Mortierella sp. AD032]
MLGRNAARPLGMIPARLVSAYGSVSAAHRLAHWMMSSRPFAIASMQRYLSIAPQLLLTSSPTSAIPTPTLVTLDGSAATNSTGASSSSCQQQQQQLHSSTTATATAAALLQQQSPLAHDILLPADIFGTSSLASSPDTVTASEVIPSSPIPVKHNAIAYNYLLAASWHPKSRQRQQQELQKARSDAEAANTARTLLWKEKLKAAHPHPGKVDAGEDAFFHVSTRSRVALGVADGVGGWSELGVDPALFSWALMNNAENIARLTDCLPHEIDLSPTASSERNILDAQTILDGAYNELVQSGTVEAGSSTACILSLCKTTGTLRASNLGDSAFLLIRDNKCIYESPSQQHFWNCPYQLTVLPKDRQQQQQQRSSTIDSKGKMTQQDAAAATAPAPTTATTATKKTKKYVQDLPKDAVQTTHQLQDGDVIVLATDGFWDNVFTKEAIELVDRELGDIIREQQQLHFGTTQQFSSTGEIVEPLSADEILARVRALSKRLTNTARRFSLDAKRMTPFSQGARHIQSGGKVDDITVIVTLVRSTASQV